jgi:Bacterial Ig-like domain (group 3)
LNMSLKQTSTVVHIVAALTIALACCGPARAHREDAHAAPTLPQADVPMKLVAGTVVRMTIENRLTGATTQYVALRADGGDRIALSGNTLDALEDGARAEAIGWPSGSTFAVSDSRPLASPKAEADLQPRQAVQIEGTLLLAHLDFPDSGRGEYLYMLRDDAGRTTRLNLASDDGVAPGVRIAAQGTLSADGRSLDVSVLTITGAPAPKARTEGQPIGQAITNNVLVILLKFTDSPASDPFTQAQVQDVMTNATTGVAHYYSEVSYGQQILNITVTNWLVGRNPSTHAPMPTPSGCDFDTMGSYGNTAAVDAGYTGSYHNWFYVMPPNGACGFLGVSYIGGNTAWSNGVNDIKVYAHELGHNFGLYHAASLTCAGGASIGGTCSSSEYGDPFDVMGNISSMHFNSAQKAKLGWIPSSSIKTQGSGFQQYSLDALEIGSGSTYAVNIPIAANPNRTYWIEYRQPLGFDSALTPANASAAQIRVANPFETCTGCQIFLGLNFSDDTELLDMTAGSTPGTFSDAGLSVGSTFIDSAYGITIQVVSADGAHLVLNVTTPGGSTTPTTTTLVSALNPAVSGNNVAFTATVGGSAPTGTVKFTDAGTVLAGCSAVPLTGAGNTRSATCSTSALATGTHSIVASYSGDGSNSASSSPSLSQIINTKAVTTTGLVSATNPSIVGATATFTASVTGTTPTGTVSFNDGGTAISGCGSVALTGAGNTRGAVCSTAVLSAGVHGIVATYSGDGVNAGSSGAVSQIVNATGATTTGLTSGNNPSISGSTVTFTATVAGTTPTGAVNFTDGGTSVAGCAAVALTGAGNIRTAACSTATLTAGTHNIVAAYSGDGSNAASSSPSLSQVVNTKAATTTALISAINPSIIGANVVFTASVTGSAPTGTVSFSDAGVGLAGCAAVVLSGVGNTRSATCGTAALTSGTHSIVAAYSGDAGNLASGSTSLAQVVNKSGSTTSLSSSLNPATPGANVTFTAIVAASGPTGAVTFNDGGVALAGCSSVALTGAGDSRTATCSSSSLGVGSHSIVALYGGDNGNAASSSAGLSQVVNTSPTTTALSSGANPSLAGASVTFMASVTGSAPTGTVNFTDAGATIATCGAVAISGAGNTRTATCTTSALAVGTHNIVATYSGTPANAPSTSPSLSQSVGLSATATTLSSSANPSPAGGSVTFTASVTGNGPTGSVNFSDGGATIATCGTSALSGAGNTRTATCTTSALTTGTHSIVAAYSGNPGNASSTSTPLSQTMSPGATTTTLSSNANPSLVSASITFIASVAGNAPTGTINFIDAGTTLATCGAVALSGAGNTRTAACTTSALTVGTHSIVARYSGNLANATSSSAALLQVINNAGSTVTLSSSSNPSTVGKILTLTATVTGVSPTRTVSFADGASAIAGCGAIAVIGVGSTRTAVCATGGLSTGSHTIIATYSGDGENSPSTSGPLTQTVAGAAPVLAHLASRKVHGSAGTFDLPLSTVPTNPTSEPRMGPSQTMVFTFDKPIVHATVAVTEGTAIAGVTTFSGNAVIVTLTGVANLQYVTVTLSSVAAADGGTGGAASVRVGYLAGDVSQNRVVSVADVAQINAALAQPVTASNYLKDINASGTLTLADMAIARTNLARALPAP